VRAALARLPFLAIFDSMASTIKLACDDAAVRRALGSWLDATGLEPPGDLTLDVRVGTPTPPSGDARPAFRQPGVVVRSGPPEGGVRLWWEVAPALADVASGAPVARVTLSPKAAAQLARCTETFLITVLIFLLRRAGWHHVHAATAIEPAEGRGWLLAGNAAAGKSTTAALLATRGWAVGTDDLAFLVAGGARVAVAASRAPIALRETGRRLLHREGGVPLGQRDKFAFWPEDLGGVWAPRVEPDIILFPSIGDGRTTATSLRQRETLAELVRWSAWVVLEPELAQPHLDLLGALARQARAYRVTLGRDLFARPDRLLELVA
jgi:hypothetical protein